MICQICNSSDYSLGFVPCANKDCSNSYTPSPKEQHTYVGYEGTCLDCHQCFDHYNHKNTKCMRSYCWEERFDTSCLCQDHTAEVLRGEANAPPLRGNIDYVSTSRPAILVDCCCDNTEQIAPKSRSLIFSLRKLVRDFKDKL